MTNELFETLRVLFLMILVIGTPLIIIEIYLALKKINEILKDTTVISNTASKIAEDESHSKQFTSEILSNTANDVIDTQTSKMALLVSKGLVSLINSKTKEVEK